MLRGVAIARSLSQNGNLQPLTWPQMELNLQNSMQLKQAKLLKNTKWLDIQL